VVPMPIPLAEYLGYDLTRLLNDELLTREEKEAIIANASPEGEMSCVCVCVCACVCEGVVRNDSSSDRSSFSRSLQSQMVQSALLACAALFIPSRLMLVAP